MSNNEVMEYENFLNRHAKVGKWKYIDWNALQAMFDTSQKEPVCLVAFNSKHGTGIDPYYGLPYQKYLYYIQTGMPRDTPEEFIDVTGVSLLEVLEEKYQAKFLEINPEWTFHKTLFKFKVMPQPPVVEGHFEISLSCTFKLPSKGGVSIEVESDGKELKAKAHGAFENVIGSFSMDLGSRSGSVTNLGIKSSVLGGDFGNGEFKTQLTSTLPLPGGLIKIKSSGSYTGTEKRYINGVEWDLEYTLEYEVEATIKKNDLKQEPDYVKYIIPVKVPDTSLADRYANIDTGKGYQSSWWDRHGDTVVAGAEIAGGIVLVGLAVVLTVGTDGLAAPFTALMARRGTIVTANAFYAAQQALTH